MENAIKVTKGLLGALCVVVVAVLVTAPIKIKTTICLGRCTGPNGLMSAVRFTARALTKVPSVVFNLFKVVFFKRAVNFNCDVLANSLALALVILPLVAEGARRTLGAMPSDCERKTIKLKTKG